MLEFVFSLWGLIFTGGFTWYLKIPSLQDMQDLARTCEQADIDIFVPGRMSQHDLRSQFGLAAAVLKSSSSECIDCQVRFK